MLYEPSNIFYDFMRIHLFSKFKDTNIMYTMLLGGLMYLWNDERIRVQILSCLDGRRMFAWMHRIVPGWTRRSIVLEGKRCEVMYSYRETALTTHTFSEKFQAVWKYIEDHMSEFSDVYHLQEFHSMSHASVQGPDPTKVKIRNLAMFIISQPSTFLLDPHLHIYGHVQLTKQISKNERNEGREIDVVRITLYSYVTSMEHLRAWLDDVHTTYRTAIQGARSGNQYIYTLFPMVASATASNGGQPLTCWNETVFDTTRQFSNLFFQEKAEVLKKIDFFLHNREWYYEYGIPYTLGIGLYGKPGTGKTSFIKCLAKYTGRHVVLLSFKHIRTKKQLENYFFESQYHVGNEEGSVGFDKKILVMEDIDCIGDIVLDRSRQFGGSTSVPNVAEASYPRGYEKKENVTLAPKDRNGKEDVVVVEECLTLDDILNLLDGIRETPGRILVITSNHYDRLDPALVRPGRIDLTLPMTYASHDTIRQIYAHFFKTPIDESVFLSENMTAEYQFSPAELVNMYVNSHGNPDKFLSRLMST